MLMRLTSGYGGILQIVQYGIEKEIFKQYEMKTIPFPGDHALVDLACIGHFNPKAITVNWIFWKSYKSSVPWDGSPLQMG